LADQALAGCNLAAVVAHRGQNAESLSILGDVVRTREMLVELEPGVLSHRHDLAIAHQQLGQLLVSSNEFASAKEHYAESRRVLRSGVADSPKDHHLLSSLGRTVSNLGMIEARLGNHEGAIASLEHAAEYQQQAVDLMPANLHYKQLLEHHHERILEIRTPPPPNTSGLTINDSGGR